MRSVLLLSVVFAGCLGSPYAGRTSTGSTLGDIVPEDPPPTPTEVATSDRAATTPAAPAAAAAADQPVVSAQRLELEVERAVIEIYRRDGDAGLRAVTEGDDARSRLVYAQAMSRVGKGREARDAYARLIDERPDLLAARYGFARLLFLLGDHALAIEQLDAAAATETAAGAARHPDAAWLRGACYLEGPDPARGERLLREELSGRGGLYAAMYLGRWLVGEPDPGVWYAERSRLVEAEAVVDTVLGQPGAREPALVLFKAHIRCAMNDWKAGIDLYRELLEAAPEYVDARFHLAIAERQVGQLKLAIEQLEYLTGPLADNPWVMRSRAEIEERLTKYRQEAASGQRLYQWNLELMAVLRSDQTNAKLRALKAAQGMNPKTLDRAVHIAIEAPEGLVRTAAVRLWPAADAGFDGLVASAINDEDFHVRAAAAERAPELPAERGESLLLTRMGVEEEGTVFKALHEGLRQLHGSRVHLPIFGESEVETRRETYRAWREYCAR